MDPVFDKMLSRVPELLGIFVTDKDGVVITEQLQPELPSRVIDPPLSATFSVAMEQSSKLKLGASKRVITQFQNYTIVQSKVEDVIVTLVSTREANLDTLLTFSDLLLPIVEEISK